MGDCARRRRRGGYARADLKPTTRPLDSEKESVFCCDAVKKVGWMGTYLLPRRWSSGSPSGPSRRRRRCRRWPGCWRHPWSPGSNYYYCFYFDWINSTLLVKATVRAGADGLEGLGVESLKVMTTGRDDEKRLLRSWLWRTASEASLCCVVVRLRKK